ncbi:UV radiation resistance protein and autophagy-related subunit 14-domain-containing protein [Gilbertella persicaria]|uniref:UV radiation resistance protein and autophagy-related subunit 14-domain-containing protein n=1 Tax=Gilbertella persicaria TaxID=101096 RepID=UPI00221E5114|nr:UV radiation resistance protein and autophagy-related subunit 14-domain-containing protein [Gilbertella persicaria]KAI8078023.1 UV radiation resistance protein and autophagy-related subunit 14-domain-containing protein [Gilbertella persicaria]
MTVGTRRILVKEVTSLFELKPGVVEESQALQKYPKEELNAPIGLVIHMLGLVVRYLGIKLPFMIFQKGIQHYIRMIPPNTQIWSSTRKFPLFLEEDDKNFKRFVVGMAMLNYNLAYLCHTQGVKIPVSQVVNTLQSLMACCRAPGLGM